MGFGPFCQQNSTKFWAKSRKIRGPGPGQLGPGVWVAMAQAHGPTYRQGVIPEFTLPDTLEKNFVRDLASKSTKLAETL